MFEIVRVDDGVLFDRSRDVYPYIARGVSRASLSLEAEQTHIGMVAQGAVRTADCYGDTRLGAGMFFCIRGAALVAPDMPDTTALVISGSFFNGLRQFGGPLELEGRLRYVDGCSDTVLLSPSRKGEPCLNHLHIPNQVSQRQHYHPSDRVGIIFHGAGICHTDRGDFELSPGMAWRVPAGLNHYFETGSETLDVITWHPDSDFGPTDGDHPMINRTWVR